ncbi:MAG TPA: ABC transporter permease subunit [Stellaceae bacterium]|nr:ABC transporter permease subunit [Stellaceae bacterium]
MTTEVAPLASGDRVWWRDERYRSIVIQIVTVVVVVATIGFFAENAIINMDRQGIASGFGFLWREAGFGIGVTPIAYSPSDTYGRALLVGILNTLIVAGIGCVLTTILGTLLGIARLSTNLLVRQITLWYIEIMRNTPLLIQLIIWWDVLRISAPGPRQAWQILPGIFISNRGLTFPVLRWQTAHLWMLAALIIGILATGMVSRWAKARRERTGEPFHTVWAGVALTVGLPLLVFLAFGAPLGIDAPKLAGFNFEGGQSITPEFAALLFGLVAFTSAFVAEIVRGGIQAVSWGQTEAAAALGLRRGQVLRLVVLPQAIRVIIPPMTSEYLSLTKNSSLAVFVGFQELTSIANTIMNQTGQAIEGIALLMAVYLTISLAISVFMNWFNRYVALVDR